VRLLRLERGCRASLRGRAARLGSALASREIGLVYGGGNVGLMGILADSVVEHGGEVIGVIPEFLERAEVAHAGSPRCTSWAPCTSARRSWPRWPTASSPSRAASAPWTSWPKR
jgi:hypothetical protein